jgi:hypothetical protein
VTDCIERSNPKRYQKTMLFDLSKLFIQSLLPRQVLSNWFQFLPTVSKLFGVICEPGVRSVLTGYRSFQAFKTCISPL